MAHPNLELKTNNLSALSPLAAIFEPKKLANDLATHATKLLQKPVSQIDTAIFQSEPLTEFHSFPHLPGETRAKIWKLSMADRRIVEVKYSKQIYHPISPTPAPVLLHVCRESRAETEKCYSLLYSPHFLTPCIYINPEIDTLYFSEKRGGEFNDVFRQSDDTYIDYFKVMTKNIQQCVLTDLRRVAIVDNSYLGSMNWDGDRKDAFHLTKFTNLAIASVVIDTEKMINGPVKLVQVTWGACPIHKKLRHIRPHYDNEEVVHSYNLCGCPFIKEVLLWLGIDDMLFEQLRVGLQGMFHNFEKKLPGWKVPKTKCMVFTDKKRDVKKGSFEFRFKKSKHVRKPRIAQRDNTSSGGMRDSWVEQHRTTSF